MQYTTILTHQPGRLWHATVPALPDCEVEAPTRAEAIEKITARIHTIIPYTEVLQIEVSASPQNGKLHGKQQTDENAFITPQAWMGKFQDDPS